MPLLDTASAGEIRRVLELFPVAALREQWPDLAKLQKEELSEKVATKLLRIREPK